MTQEEEDYLVDQYTTSGFKMSLQFYQHKVISFPATHQDEIANDQARFLQNRYLSWQAAHDSGIFSVNIPSLAIYPSKVQSPIRSTMPHGT